MAKSKYEYVKEFETDDKLLRNVFILVRVDGKGFHKFSAAHQFNKPNDVRALNLMNHAARSVMHELDDIVLAFGESDEYSFLFRRSTDLYQRRESKIVSTVVSLFTSAYVYYWNDYFTDSRRPLYPPVFDGRAVLYPSEVEVKDYFAWRQADTHINNLFNTSFWALVEKGGMTPKAAEVKLSGTDSKDKNEMLFTEFNTNYSKLPAIFRKGSVLLREHILKSLDKDHIIPTLPETLPGSTSADASVAESTMDTEEDTATPSISETPSIDNKRPLESDGATDEGDPTSEGAGESSGEFQAPPGFKRMKKGVVIDHIDIIGPKFWSGRGAYILAPEKRKKTGP
ncbi:tRNA(His) guanylyltransferase [Entomortierella parvispora]|uniref:tRNA(His) guanylyltransferase n=1 Tax=Entomortierella parvispora TaxID=205924 RepID=A0A9P3M1I6_9FUNG|nr:tRNA(His) guanylyltransferase [Entomortierella parvispora]